MLLGCHVVPVLQPHAKVRDSSIPNSVITCTPFSPLPLRPRKDVFVLGRRSVGRRTRIASVFVLAPVIVFASLQGHKVAVKLGHAA